jgi:hypothetical protein
MVDITQVNNPDEFELLDGADLEECAQQCVAMMVMNQNVMAANSESYWKYLTAKEAYSHYRQIASVMQSLLRAGR